METKAGTRVPERTIPDPTPEKMRPAASPRLFSGTKGRMVGAASTMSEPPVKPDTNRHTKNQTKEIGVALAKNATVAPSIMRRKARFQSDERRVGKRCVSTFRSGWCQDHSNK